MKKIVLIILSLFLFACAKNTIPLASGDVNIISLSENRKTAGENFYVLAFEIKNSSELNIHKSYISIEVTTNKKTSKKSIEIEKFIGEQGVFYVDYNFSVSDDETLQGISNIKIIDKYFQ